VGPVVVAALAARTRILAGGGDGLDRIGRLIERHEAFAQRVNVQFVGRLSASEVIMCTRGRGRGAPVDR